MRILDASVFGEILCKIGQYSPVVRVEKTKDKFVITSISTDELSFALIAFSEPFFEKWASKTESPIEIESRTLFDVSKIIKANSKVDLDLSNGNLHIEIEDQSFKDVNVTRSAEESNSFETPKMGRIETKFKVNSKEFLSTIRELNNLLDETQLLLQGGAHRMIFSGKRSGMTVKIHLQEANVICMDDLCIEFPIKFIQHFLPLLNHFEKLSLSFGQKTPLRIEGNNGRWKLTLMISKIEKLA